MELDAGRVDGLIDGIYEAAVAPDRWSSVLQEVGQMIGATNGSALWFDAKETSLLRAATWDVDSDVVAAYGQHYVTICPRLRLSRLFGAGQIYDDRNLRKHASPTNREYYDFMDSIGCGLARTVLGERNEQLRMGLTFYGPICEDDSEVEHRLLLALAPHVRRAAHLTMRVADLGERAEFGENLFEMSSAMLLVDKDGRATRMNARAEEALALDDGLSLIRGHLKAARPAEDDRLKREIAVALKTRTVPLAEGFALVSRPSGRPGWAVSAVPLPHRHRLGKPSTPPQALVTLSETVPRVSPARLRRGFGLSVAEAEIASSLAAGKTLDEIADDRRTSPKTVRSQFKGIFAKMEVSTQAQLVGRAAAVASLPGLLRAR